MAPRKTPLRLQAEPVECAAVALGIALEYFGNNVSGCELKDALGVSRNGASAQSIVDTARRYGLAAEGLRLSAHQLKKETSLAILYFDHGHFVVWEGYGRGRFHINDPAQGRKALPPAEFTSRYSGVVIRLEKTEVFNNGLRVLVRTSLRVAVHRSIMGAFGGMFALMVAFGYVSLLHQVQRSRVGMPILVPVFAFSSVSFLLAAAMWWIAKYTGLKHSSHEAYAASINLSRKLTHQSEEVLGAFVNRILSQTLTTVSHNAWKHEDIRAERSFAYGATIIFVLLLPAMHGEFIVILLAVLLVLLWRVILWCARDLPFAMALAQSNEQHAVAQAHQISSDIEAMGQSRFLLKRLMKSHFDTLAPMGTAFTTRIWRNLWWALLALTVCGMVMMGVDAVVVGTVAILTLFIKPICTVRPVVPSDLWLSAMTSLPTTKSPKNPDTDSQAVQLHNVNFGYRGERSQVLNNIDLAIERGEMVAIVGRPKSGVSTLLKIMAGFLQPVGGTAAIVPHGQLIDSYSLPFAGSLKDNLTLYDTQFDEAHMVWALKKACALDLFFNRPLGLLFPIEADGTNLSVGEKKRLVLARSLMRKPDLVVLDSFFSSQSPDGALAILANLKSDTTTTVFSSFRVSELMMADRIVFLDGGHIADQGSHQQLFDRNARYRELLSLPAQNL